MLSSLARCPWISEPFRHFGIKRIISPWVLSIAGFTINPIALSLKKTGNIHDFTYPLRSFSMSLLVTLSDEILNVLRLFRLTTLQLRMHNNVNNTFSQRHLSKISVTKTDYF